MSKAQWLFEYAALRRAQDHEEEFFIKALKRTLITVLGLNLLPPQDEAGNFKTPETITEADKEQFIPMIIMAGNHHLMRGLWEKYNEFKTMYTNTTDDANIPVDTVEDIHDDMEPLDMEDPFENVPIDELLRQKVHKDLGIKVEDLDSAIPLETSVDVVSKPRATVTVDKVE